MTSVRLPWEDVPAAVREAVGDALGAEVVEAVNQAGGYGPSLAARCRLADGRRVFVKAAAPSVNPQTPEMLRDEVAVTRRLPSWLPVPRLLHSHDDGEWIVAVFEEIEGRQPRSPWDPAELQIVLTAVEALATAADPSPVRGLPPVAERLRPMFSWWRRAAAGADVGEVDDWARPRLERLAALEEAWEAGTGGTALLHCDIRSDNILLGSDGRVWFVDWPHAAVGAAWIDLLLMLPSVALGGGPEPQQVWAASPLAATADPGAVTAMIAAFDGYFTFQSRQPDPPGLPHVRGFQAALAPVTRRWLRARTDLE